MKLVKKIFRSQYFKRILCKLVYFYIKFILLTSRVKIIFNGFDFLEFEKMQSIYATWHGRVLYMPIINPSKISSCAIVSDHNDGRLIGGVIENAGVKIIYGSSNRRRISALKEIMHNIGDGLNFLITPDGPRGPACVVDGAIINIASSSGLPVIPGSCSAKRAKIFNSWDSFFFPFPFNNIVIVFNKPIFIPKKIAIEEKQRYNLILEESLNEATDIADRLCQRKK